MPEEWIVNPNTGRKLKVGSRRYNLIYKYGGFFNENVPDSTPPNNNINSAEFKQWIFKVYEYYRKKDNPESISQSEAKMKFKLIDLAKENNISQ